MTVERKEKEEEMKVLKLTVHGRLVGYLAGFQNGRNVLSFADDYRQDSARPTFSLITHPPLPPLRQRHVQSVGEEPTTASDAV